MMKHKNKTKSKSGMKNVLFLNNSPFKLIYNKKGKVVGEIYTYVFDQDEINISPTAVDGMDLQFDEDMSSNVNASYENTSLIYYCPREPYGPPAPPPPPVKPPPIKDGPKTAADKKVNIKMVGILDGNKKDPAWRILVESFWSKISRVGKIKGVKVPWLREIFKKYEKCDLNSIKYTFYAHGRPYWGKPDFYPTKPFKGYGAKGLSGASGGSGIAIGELTCNQYQNYGAKAHILCERNEWITFDLGKIGEILIKTVTFKKYKRKFYFTQLDTTKDGGSFKNTFVKWKDLPIRPGKVPSEFGSGVTDMYY